MFFGSLYISDKTDPWTAVQGQNSSLQGSSLLASSTRVDVEFLFLTQVTSNFAAIHESELATKVLLKMRMLLGELLMRLAIQLVSVYSK